MQERFRTVKEVHQAMSQGYGLEMKWPSPEISLTFQQEKFKFYLYQLPNVELVLEEAEDRRVVLQVEKVIGEINVTVSVEKKNKMEEKKWVKIN